MVARVALLARWSLVWGGEQVVVGFGRGAEEVVLAVLQIHLGEGARGLAGGGDAQRGDLDQGDRPDHGRAEVEQQGLERVVARPLQGPAAPPGGALAEQEDPNDRAGRRERAG